VTAIVIAVKRRLLTILLTLAAASLTAGCTTFTDNDVAARVNDVEYSHDDLSGIIDAIGIPEESTTDLGTIRSVATTLILAGALNDYFGEQSIKVTDADRDVATQGLAGSLPTFLEATDDVQDLLVDAQAHLTIVSALPNGAQAQLDAINAADVYIDPRIGTFDSATGAVVALG
jgi:hypothetical protein